MPERLNFVSFYARPGFSSPREPFGRVAELMGSRVGVPVEVMLLDYETGQTCNRPLPLGDGMLDVMPGPTEILFVYATSGDSVAGQSCVGLEVGPGTAVVTVSLPDLSMAADAKLVSEVCARLHGAGTQLAERCVVAAGGECEIDASLPTAAAALGATCAWDSLAAWVACDAAALSELPGRYVLVRRVAPNTAVLRDGGVPAR